MAIQAITLMEAYIIENLRKDGISNKELLTVTDESISKWQTINDRFDYKILKDLAEKSGDQYASIINKGYMVKFLTLNGLINLVQLKLGKKRDVDFIVHDDGISNLVVDAGEMKEVRQILSPNWLMTEMSGGLSIRSAY